MEETCKMSIFRKVTKTRKCTRESGGNCCVVLTCWETLANASVTYGCGEFVHVPKENLWKKFIENL